VPAEFTLDKNFFQKYPGLRFNSYLKKKMYLRSYISELKALAIFSP
jgi:hypothetical protein